MRTSRRRPPARIGTAIVRAAVWSAPGMRKKCTMRVPLLFGSRQLVPVDAVRLGWGMVLLAAPGEVLRLTGGSGRHASAVARLLGARHVLQALALGAMSFVPSTVLPATARRQARRLGAVVDAAHAASAVALAAAGREPRTWVTDGALASSFAAATWRSADRERTRNDHD